MEKVEGKRAEISGVIKAAVENNEVGGDKTNIGKEIRRQLANRGISLKDAASRLGVTKQALNYVLSNKLDKNWKKYEVRHYCEVLRLKEENIMRWMV